MQAQVTFVEHKPQQITGSNGPFTLHKFKATDGSWFDTSKTDIANAAYALLNQPVVVTYDETQNGQYTNRRINAVQAVGAAGAMAPGVLPTAVASVPAAPTVGAPAQAAPQQQTAPQATGTRQPAHPDEAGRIARSVGHSNGLTALELALKAHEHGIAEIKSTDDWLVTAKWVAAKAVDLGGEIGAYIFKGSHPAPSPDAERANSSGAVGETGGAAAPVAAPPVTVPADDDIPF